MLWGINSATQNSLSLIEDGSGKGAFVGASILSSLGATALVPIFAAKFVSDRPRHFLRFSAIAVTSAIAGWFLFDPAAFASLVADGLRFTTRYRLVAIFFVFVPFFLAFYVALALLGGSFLRLGPGRRRKEIAVILREDHECYRACTSLNPLR